jgi:hypothetical protein
MTRSAKTLLSPVGDSGSSAELDKPSRRIARKDVKSGLQRDKQNPKAQRVRKLERVEEWCRGKRESYK